MSGWTSDRDEVLLAIVEKAPDLEFAGKAVQAMNYFSSMRDTATQRLIDRIMASIDPMLEKKDYTGALKFISSENFTFNKDPLLSKILEKMEEKDFTKENLKLIEGVVGQLSHEKRKEVLQKLVDKYTSLGDTQEASRVKAKITKIEERERKFQELINWTPHDFKPPVKTMLVLGGITGGCQASILGFGVGAVCLSALSAAAFAGLACKLMYERTFPHGRVHRFQGGMFSF